MEKTEGKVVLAVAKLYLFEKEVDMAARQGLALFYFIHRQEVLCGCKCCNKKLNKKRVKKWIVKRAPVGNAKLLDGYGRKRKKLFIKCLNEKLDAVIGKVNIN